jgi:hypothetical protein
MKPEFRRLHSIREHELLYRKFCRYLAAMQVCPGMAAR